jgi:hypothetical protein
MASNNFNEFYKKFYVDKHELETHKARLFPASEKLKVIDEDVTSSIFLANLVGIKEFYYEFFQEIDVKINKYMKIHAFTQIAFDSELQKDKPDIPDGMIVITEGKSNPIVRFVFLLEFKTKSKLEKEQIERYATIARNHKYKFDGIISVSNDFVSNPKQNPFGFRQLTNFKYYHFSWTRIQSLLQYVINEGIADGDQDYLAEQFLLYLRDHKFIRNFDQMNKNWTEDSKILTTQNKLSKLKDRVKIENAALDWLQEEQDICLKTKVRYSKNIVIKLSENEKTKINQRLNSIKDSILSDNRNFSTIYRVTPNGHKSMPYSVTKRKHIDIQHQILLKQRTQTIKFEIVVDNHKYKTLRKQVSAFITSLLLPEPARSDEIEVLSFIDNKRLPVSKTTINELSIDVERDVLKSFTDKKSDSSIRKFEIQSHFDISNEFKYRTKFISKVEQNFDNFYTQVIEPFIID